MIKTIVITVDTDTSEMSMKHENITPIEALGLLKFFEKSIWLSMQSGMIKTDLPKTDNKNYIN